MSLPQAISQLEEDLASYNQGTKTQPAEGSTDWYILRAKALGLSMLKRMQQLGIEDDPAAAERFYRQAGKVHKQAEVPPEVVVEREKLPEGLILRA